MARSSDPYEDKKVPCDICRKEVPLSAALTPEASDYVAHFCGLECYEVWKKQGVGKQGGKAGK